MPYKLMCHKAGKLFTFGVYPIAYVRIGEPVFATGNRWEWAGRLFRWRFSHTPGR